MNWKHQQEMRQHPDFVDYQTPSMHTALFAVVIAHPSASDVEKKKLFSDVSSRFLADILFDLGVDETGVLKCAVSRRPIRNMQDKKGGVGPIIASDKKLLTLYDSNKQFRKNLEAEENHLWETLAYWNLPVLVLGKFADRVVSRFEASVKIDQPTPPFIYRTFSANYMMTKANAKQKKKFEQKLKRFSVQVLEWHRQNTAKIKKKLSKRE